MSVCAAEQRVRIVCYVISEREDAYAQLIGVAQLAASTRPRS